jgi:hypothetical protein
MAGMCKVWRAITTSIRDYSRVDEMNGVKKFDVWVYGYCFVTYSFTHVIVH